jgi:hypothetical protein
MFGCSAKENPRTKWTMVERRLGTPVLGRFTNRRTMITVARDCYVFQN